MKTWKAILVFGAIVVLCVLLGAKTIEKAGEEVSVTTNVPIALEPKSGPLKVEITGRIEQYKLVREEQQVIYDILKLRYEKENLKLRMLAERRELQFKIATYESKMNIRVAKPVVEPVDPNE